MKVVLDIPDYCASAIGLTLIGTDHNTTNVISRAIDLSYYHGQTLVIREEDEEDTRYTITGKNFE